jgi:serine/threonine protein kinase
MMTGKIPYKDFSTAQIIGMVGNDENHHIEVPDYPNKVLLDIFLSCTERDPNKRPSFKQIVRDIEALEEQMEKDICNLKIILAV